MLIGAGLMMELAKAGSKWRKTNFYGAHENGTALVINTHHCCSAGDSGLKRAVCREVRDCALPFRYDGLL